MEDNNYKITNSIDIMISDAMLKLQFYGEFCLFINFKLSNTLSTCGVNIDISGMKFYFNPEFVDELTQEEMNFVMLHEIFHLLWDHKSRTRRCGYEHELSNVVQDMIINDVIKTDIVDKMKYYNKLKGRNLNFADIPVDRKTNKSWVLHKPEEYKGELYFEEMYEWIIIEKNKYDEWKRNCKCDKKLKCKCNKAHGKEECDCPICPVSDYLRKIFDQLEMGLLDFLDTHIPDDIPPEYRKSIVDNIKNSLAGFLTKDIQVTLDKITKSKKDYVKDIKIGVNELFGDYKQKSITKRNRRSIPGVKGKRKDSYALTTILDVSGSMEGYFEKVLSYIFQNNITMELIQIDTEVKGSTTIKNKSDIKKIKIKGLGGTLISPAIRYVSNDKNLKKLNLLILTDGETDILDFKGFNKKCLIISVKKECRVMNIRDNKIKQIVIKE